MTENEAIEKIKEKACNNRCIPELCNDGCMYGNEKCAFSMAIQALETVQKYKDLESELSKRNLTIDHIREYIKFEDECVEMGFTFKSLLEAREKQSGKKPEIEGDGFADGTLVYDTWMCPCCHKSYEIDYDNYDYCPSCGQKIDWEVYENGKSN